MSNPVSFAKHPIHPMLVAFPIGLWIFSFLSDLVHLFGGSEAWSTVAFYTLGAGIAGGVLAAVPGLVDFLSIDENRIRDLAFTHMLLGVGALLLMGLSFWLRVVPDQTPKLALVLSALGVTSAGLGAWYGGEMVYVKGMAVAAVEKLDKKLRAEKSGEGPTSLKRAG